MKLQLASEFAASAARGELMVVANQRGFGADSSGRQRHMRAVDPIGRGVSVFLAGIKTWRRQAVMVEEPAGAALLLALSRAPPLSRAPARGEAAPQPGQVAADVARCPGALNVQAQEFVFG